METQTIFFGEKTEITLWQSLRSQSNLVTVDVDLDVDGCAGLVDGCAGLGESVGVEDGCAGLDDGCAGLDDGCAGLWESVGVEDEVHFVILGEVTRLQEMLHDIMTGWVY